MKTLETKLDKLIEDVTDLKIKQAQQDIIHQTNSTNLAEHMRRTELNERRIESMEEITKMLRLGGTIFGYLWKISISILGICGTVLGVILALKELNVI